MKTLFDHKYNLVCEGGAAGHMAHPFDLPSVKAPIDIVKFFDNLTAALKKDEKAFMKIDGINASVRLNDTGAFVLDRMSMKPLDVKGVTKDDLAERFGAGHGFLKIGAVVLDIFNEALPAIQTELRMLGMNGCTRMLNIEYVEGTTNVIETDKKFIAIHGLLDIIQVSPKKRVTKEVSSYNKGALNKLIEKVNVVAEKYGFEVYNQFLAMLDTEPDYKKVLANTVAININGKTESKRLADWIMQSNTVNTDIMIMSKTKGKVGAVSKYVLQFIMKGGDIADEFQADADIALSGFLMYYTTMVLGAELLRCINSDLGRGDTQEGIVIRNTSLTGVDRPVKITGNFIINGTTSKFNESLDESIFGNLGIDDGINNEILSDWANKYINAVNNSLIAKNTNNARVSLKGKAPDNRPIVDTCWYFFIRTEPKHDLVPDGVLPEYCDKLLLTRNINTIIVDSDKQNPLRSFAHLPQQVRASDKTINIDLHGYYDTLDFSDIKYGVNLKICNDVTAKQLRNISWCNALVFDDHITDLNDINNILKTFKNCNFYDSRHDTYEPFIQGSKLNTTSDSLSEYIRLIQKLGLYYYHDNAETLKKLKLNGFVPNTGGVITIKDYIFKNISYEFLKFIDPKKVNFVKLDNNNSKKDIFLSKKELELLPENVVLSISYNPLGNAYSYYEDLVKDTMKIFADRSSGKIYIKK